MKVPPNKTVYYKGKIYKAGAELPAGYEFPMRNEKKLSEKKPEMKPVTGEKNGFTPSS